MMARATHVKLLGAAAAGLLTAGGTTALAHPHIWINVETTVIYENGTVTALRQRWIFDEFYSSMAIQGLDANGDGTYDRKELAELAKVNIEGLRAFDYFTFAKLGGQAIAFTPPTEFLMEHVESAQPPGQDSGGTATAGPAKEPQSIWARLTRSLTGSAAPPKTKVLALEFSLPLSQPVLADAEGFSFSTYDPSFFIWFDLAKDTPVRLAEGAPAGCKAEIPSPPRALDMGQLGGQLSEADFNQGAGATISVSMARSVTLSCPR